MNHDDNAHQIYRDDQRNNRYFENLKGNWKFYTSNQEEKNSAAKLYLQTEDVVYTKAVRISKGPSIKRTGE